MEIIKTSRIIVKYDNYASALFGSRIDSELVPLEKGKGTFFYNRRTEIVDESISSTTLAFNRIQQFLRPLEGSRLVRVLGDCPGLNGAGLSSQEIHTRNSETCEQVVKAISRIMSDVNSSRFLDVAHGLGQWADFFDED